MPYVEIEQRIHSLLTDTLDSDVSVTRGYHQPDSIKSVKLTPGRADRQA